MTADAMLEALQRGGVKMTPQRRAIVRAFAGDPTHPTAQEIFARLTGSFPGMSFATVYNTLGTLRAAGLCREMAVEVGAARFDPNPGHHDHTVCDTCGAVRDVPAHERAAPAMPGFHVRSVEQIYRGECEACSRTRAAAAAAKTHSAQPSHAADAREHSTGGTRRK